jgi:UDPglucose--hexose-1-phosphate uridylyltransferase
MPEIRFNAVTQDWIIFAGERARRPDQFAEHGSEHPPRASRDPGCPFCPGNEGMTPPESFRLPANGDWKVRVVPNKFAALESKGEVHRRAWGLKRVITGVGLHEVIIEAPEHDRTMPMLDVEEMRDIVRVYHQRYCAAASDPRVAHVTVFKNHGLRAGTSLVHTHSQLIATPIIPPQVRARMENALRFYDEYGDCVFCRVLAEEEADAERIVLSSKHFLAFIPFAAYSPFHTWIYPRRHEPSFVLASDEELDDLALTLRTLLRKTWRGLNDPDFNLTIRSAPAECAMVKYYHWYVSLIPRVTRIAGFELGSGMFINAGVPEQSAGFLRSVPAT